MQPLGRRHYRDKTGGKHYVDGYTKRMLMWWEEIISPNKRKDKEAAKKDIQQQLMEDD
jgi:hypothetical protein